jgi:signal-induced proliferation-associated 1 like protein 3
VDPLVPQFAAQARTVLLIPLFPLLFPLLIPLFPLVIPVFPLVIPLFPLVIPLIPLFPVHPPPLLLLLAVQVSELRQLKRVVVVLEV